MLATLIVCLTVLALFEWYLAPLGDRLVALRERRVEAELQPPARQEAVSIPDDLYALAQSFEDPWAREQAMQAMREMYGESSSWDRVRVSYGLGLRTNT